MSDAPTPVTYYVSLPYATGCIVVEGTVIREVPPAWRTWKGQLWEKFQRYQYIRYGKQMDIEQLPERPKAKESL